ncbi:P-loop NTPase [Limnochorda pilosa]|uniref:CobQ/CobB/MinD/ParA nucleotide binding domain-containing protein n=1 Tax=Limnochorda pilosa TaxID=1555112 RepID=A0A0K2SRL2_LIMPI|nr:P-loop NTPase [Limnochorda pilosa]BAS29454.1 hypothetical protein LIP_3646 [Limnochorda pilosa]
MMPREAKSGSGWTATRGAFRSGDEVLLRSDVPLRAGEYPCWVLDVGSMQVRLSTPMHEGRMVLVPVGAPVEVETSAHARFRSRVVDRVTGPGRCLVVERPVPISGGAGRTSPLIVVASGKGGVGKTCIAVNLAVGLASAGRQVLLMDLDLGAGNVDVLLGVGGTADLGRVVRGERRLRDVLAEPMPGLRALLAGSGLPEVVDMTALEYEWLSAELQELGGEADVMIVDVSSGVGARVTSSLAAASQSVVVTTPEPHAITDAYALLKLYRERHGTRSFELVVNMVEELAEGERVAGKMRFAAERFLAMDLRLAGIVPWDAAMRAAVRRQTPLAVWRPSSPAGRALRLLGETLLEGGAFIPPRRRWTERLLALLPGVR